MKTARLLLVDDHPIVREGLKTFLDLQNDLVVIAEASDLAGGLEQATLHQPDLIVLDLQLPDGNALKFLASFKTVAPQTKVLILTSFIDDFWVQEAMREGAVGYVLKHSGPKALLDYIRAALRGERPLDPSAVKALNQDKKHPLEELTRRERDILMLIAQGLSNKQIAQELGIAEKTVKTHATSIFTKLNVRDRVQAALLVKDLEV
ncbi:MAG: response regulator transcription factor [Trueperaceae bacterium]|nr:response regulator transcription factor [Trueperaceae bacterium]